jgi:hypothetical protein
MGYGSDRGNLVFTAADTVEWVFEIRRRRSCGMR